MNLKLKFVFNDLFCLYIQFNNFMNFLHIKECMNSPKVIFSKLSNRKKRTLMTHHANAQNVLEIHCCDAKDDWTIDQLLMVEKKSPNRKNWFFRQFSSLYFFTFSRFHIITAHNWTPFWLFLWKHVTKCKCDVNANVNANSKFLINFIDSFQHKVLFRKFLYWFITLFWC